jgi:hypothetical protein
MKAALSLMVLASAFLSALADDITFTKKTASFTNLQGQAYQRVQLVRGDLDGLIWRDGASGGRICYTNLHPDVLESFGISSNRIAIARARAEKKAITDARYRAVVFAKEQTKSMVQAGSTNAISSSSASTGYAVPYGPPVGYGPDYLYPPYIYGFGAPTVAASSAASALNSASTPNAGHSLNAGPAPNVGTAPSAAAAPSTPSAPPSSVPPSVPRRGR